MVQRLREFEHDLDEAPNNDGAISRDEAKGAPRLAANFDAVDANKDGVLTRDEMLAWRKANPRPSREAPPEPVKP